MAETDNRTLSPTPSGYFNAKTAAVGSCMAEIGELEHSIADDKQREEFSKQMHNFHALMQQYISESNAKLDWTQIKSPPEGTIMKYEDLVEPSPAEQGALLQKLAVLKLNGGLGTSMGCVGPKSAISVRDEHTFLDLCVQQIQYLNNTFGSSVPLVLMNSFNTHEDTAKILRSYPQKACPILQFNQSKFPRIRADTLSPVPDSLESPEGWYPPGHGDLYKSIYNSGLLDQLIADGREWIFLSNIDNLGATVDMNILNRVVNDPDCEFVMEVTDKTRADVKGGTLIEYDGTIRLLEIAQVPKEFVEEFKSVSKFRIFNTNNLWIKTTAIKRLVEEEGLHMEVIENKKTLGNGTKVIQLEQAVGSAIKNFKGAIGINVLRSRFLPVKKTSDLLLAMSNLFTLKSGTLVTNPARVFANVPLVKLGEHFSKVKEFLRRFDKIPDILELDHLTVTGDVTFTGKVTLKGTVIIIANHGERIDIPAGSILENKIVSGNLRIMEH
eukprot:m.178416 g.178416  ORF g.178416 m.178416 type:complete len:497 (+) comp10449_c4_seq3:330-1820(+)